MCEGEQECAQQGQQRERAWHELASAGGAIGAGDLCGGVEEGGACDQLHLNAVLAEVDVCSSDTQTRAASEEGAAIWIPGGASKAEMRKVCEVLTV